MNNYETLVLKQLSKIVITINMKGEPRIVIYGVCWSKAKIKEEDVRQPLCITCLDQGNRNVLNSTPGKNGRAFS